MFRQIGIGTAAVLAAGILAAGCSDDSGGDTIISGGAFLTDNFPGGTIQSNNLADDQRAFTNQGQELENTEIFWNCETGQAIRAFSTEPDDGSHESILYVAWFDGTAWHAPVEVRGINESGNDNVVGVKALWLNTAGHADTDAAARNGDAIILFTRRDAEPVFPGATTVDEDSNVRLYGLYFDVSEANAAGTPARRGGFDTVGSLIDFDNVVDLGGTGDTDGDTFVTVSDDEDFDVSTFGFASDSLCCTHAFDAGYDPVDSGEPTTFVHMVYRKDPVTGDPDADDLGERYWSVPFDITQSGNAFVQGTGANVIDLPGSLDTADTVENVSATFVVHNGHMLWTVDGIDDTASTDQALIASIFTTAASSNEIQVGSAPLDDSNDVSNLPDADDMYGRDQGIVETVFFFTESGFEDDGTDGNRSPDTDLMVGQLRIDATGVTTEGAGSPREIDAHTGTLDSDLTGDADAVPVRDGINGDVSTALVPVQTVINRTASGIAVLWNQEFSDLTDADAGDTNETTLQVNDVPFTAVYQTRRDTADARTLANAMTTTEPVGALTDPDADATADAGQEVEGDAFDVSFQGGLAQGQAVSQSGEPCDPACGFQGNHLRYSVVFTQIEDQSGGADEDNNILYVNSFVIDGGDTDTTDPTITETGVDPVEELDVNYGIDFQAVAVDAGDATTAGTPPVSTAGAGRVLIFFMSNDNNETNDGTGSFDSQRLYVSEQDASGAAGAKSLVSSDPSLQFQADAVQADEILDGIIVPTNTDAVNAPNWSGNRIFLFWTEDRNLPGSGSNIMTRSYEQGETTQTNPAVVLADRFDPPLPASATTGNTEPVQIDNLPPGDLFEVNNGDDLTVLADGETVGVYFDEDYHIYFTDSSGTAEGFDSENGAPAPQLVDNDTTLFTTIVDGYDVDHPAGNGCNWLPKSQVFFTRTDTAAGSGTERASIRVHQ